MIVPLYYCFVITAKKRNYIISILTFIYILIHVSIFLTMEITLSIFYKLMHKSYTLKISNYVCAQLYLMYIKFYVSVIQLFMSQIFCYI